MDPEHKGMVKALMREYPSIDQLMAESLVWAWAKDKLNDALTLEEKNSPVEVTSNAESDEEPLCAPAD